MITNAVTSTETESPDEEDLNENFEQQSDDEEKEGEEEGESEEGVGISDKVITTNPTTKFVDNKRKKYGKTLIGKSEGSDLSKYGQR